ncbi:ATP-binding protein [Anabaena sp. UHCC 0399]|uniref:ATP-binding protein n=1 Tax=Anabaena sp. UHCC 0399 TaxID=3110238 RepID=UPI002B20CD7C|nr:ATP-binding protein [Anabaena sp. UHCC 0399]MEA5567762.1 ATP-binding protein [Anabaena sp. UHCC 0399]
MIDTTEAIAPNSALNNLLPLLQRLDQLLEGAIASAQLVYGTEAATDPYRGMHVNPEDVERLLQQKPAVPVFQLNPQPPTESITDLITEDSPLAWLIQTFGLSDFDIDIIAIALAIELDRRYERLYAYLQDDVRCKRPSVDLALNLLCASAADKLGRRSHFSADAPLIRHNLLHLISENDRSKSTLLARELHLDDQVIRFLLQQPGLDERLATFCQLIYPNTSLNDLYLNAEIKQALATLISEDWQAQKPLQLYFQGSDKLSKHLTAEALAAAIKAPLLSADLAKIADNKSNFAATLNLICREAWFQNALLYLDGLDTLPNDQAILYEDLMRAIAQHRSITILAGIEPWIPNAAVPVEIIAVLFPVPNFAQRRICWQTQLTTAGISIDSTELDALADRFRLTPHQITSSVKNTCNAVRWQAAAEKNTPRTGLLFASARAQSGHDLTALTRKIEPQYTWDDIILPDEHQTLLREICNQTKYRNLVHEEWGFDRKLSLGKGLNVLFSGTPGTGKTMAAEVIAHELQLDLYKIDLSQIVSKYIGETEKNLNRIFTAAANSNAILLFDEADALFGKRSEVKDAHDRYANIETGYLLQKMEEYEGVVILTSNLRSNIDDAFSRRLRFIIEFPFPNEKQRRQIWEKVWIDTTPCSSDLNLDFLARRFEIAGANIRNIALAAAFLAADDGKVITMAHLLQAIRREYQKLGRIVMEEDILLPN